MLKFSSMLKKIVLASLFLCVLFISLSCSKRTLSTKNREQEVEYTKCGSQKESEDKNSTILSDEDFIIQNKDTFIKLGEPFNEMRIGEKVKLHEPCNEEHVYDTYIYKNVVLKVSFDTKKGDSIWSIRLLNSNLATARGVKIGDSISKVFEKYGVIDSDDLDSYCYSQDRRSLIFCIDENKKIIGILLEEL